MTSLPHTGQAVFELSGIGVEFTLEDMNGRQLMKGFAHQLNDGWGLDWEVFDLEANSVDKGIDSRRFQSRRMVIVRFLRIAAEAGKTGVWRKGYTAK